MDGNGSSQAHVSSSSKRIRRANGGKLLREMLEHGVLCNHPSREDCGDCKELRIALIGHTERCTRAACSMPFCGSAKGTMPLSASDGAEGSLRIRLPPRAATGESQPSDASSSQGMYAREFLAASRGHHSPRSSMTFLSPLETSKGKVGSSPDSQPPPPPPSTAETSTGEAAEEDRAVTQDVDAHNDNDTAEGDEDSAAEDAPTASASQQHQQMPPRPDQLSTVKMAGYFDGRMTFSGVWFIDDRSVQSKPFGYVYRDDDVSDPDGSLPCAACGQVTPDALARFVACDLCDQVFHLQCANLQAIPESQWFCANCTEVRTRLLPEDNVEKIRLPPTRLWTGHYMNGDKKLSEQFRLEFVWKRATEEDQVIAEVRGKGKNTYGQFLIEGKLFARRPPKSGFPMELNKVYLE